VRQFIYTSGGRCKLKCWPRVRGRVGLASPFLPGRFRSPGGRRCGIDRNDLVSLPVLARSLLLARIFLLFLVSTMPSSTFSHIAPICFSFLAHAQSIHLQVLRPHARLSCAGFRRSWPPPSGQVLLFIVQQPSFFFYHTILLIYFLFDAFLGLF